MPNWGRVEYRNASGDFDDDVIIEALNDINERLYNKIGDSYFTHEFHREYDELEVIMWALKNRKEKNKNADNANTEA